MIGDFELNSVNHCDLFALCDGLPDASADMVLCDLPYGTTACSWDTVIPFAPMWERFKRVIKPRGAIVLTASQPFTSALVMSNIRDYAYSWLWVKNRVTGFANAKKQPLRRFEDIPVFGTPKYFPQGLRRLQEVRKNGVSTGGHSIRGGLQKNAGKGQMRTAGLAYVQEFTDYPDNVLYFDCPIETVHGTQKPVALFEYLIRTYTREGDVVLDPCVGSGTTALAARNAKRHWVCGDSDAHYCDVARDRLRLPFEPRRVKAENDLSGLPLFAQDAP